MPSRGQIFIMTNTEFILIIIASCHIVLLLYYHDNSTFIYNISAEVSALNTEAVNYINNWPNWQYSFLQ
jgi:hypothetical protein